MRNLFTRHRAWRPAIDQKFFDWMICFSDFATLNHISDTIVDAAFWDQDALSLLALLQFALNSGIGNQPEKRDEHIESAGDP